MGSTPTWGTMRTDILDRKDEILEWISKSYSNAEICRKLQCKPETLRSYYNKMGINYKGNQGGKNIKHCPKKKSIYEVINSSSFTNSTKRIRLIEEGFKENKCECCGLSTWMGKPIPLELHHKDFNHHNNDLDNLVILCSNCHMQAHNYCNTKKD